VIQTLHLGPLAVPPATAVQIVAIAGGLLVGHVLNRRHKTDLDKHVWRALLICILVSRFAFVYGHRAGYVEAPWDVFDIRDGGWEPQVGVIAAWLYVLYAIQRTVGLRRPLLASVCVATVVWASGAIALIVLDDKDAVELSPVVLATMDGGTASLAQFGDRPLVVNLWATWCPPCLRELPLLQRAQAEHPEVHFVFLNQGESEETVRRFLASRGFSLRNVLLDARGQASQGLNSGALPTTQLFDAHRRLLGTHLGELSAGTLMESLAKIGVHL